MGKIKETPLCKLAYKYRTDKCPRIKHVYTPFYYEMFKDRRNLVKKVFEMGIGYDDTMPHCGDVYEVGASLRMWRDFFPNAQVYGADISAKAMFRSHRIKTYICDETKPDRVEELIKRVGTDIDLFVDDGLHHYKYQALLAKTVLPLINDGVTYIIEDISHTRTVARELSKYKCEAPELPNRKFRHGKLLVIRK
jgi:hypothetical protein